MTSNEIKTALQNGQKVNWKNQAYEVKSTKKGTLQVISFNGSAASFTEEFEKDCYIKN